MTIAEMKHHFTHRELGIQGAVGEYAAIGQHHAFGISGST